MIDLSRDLGRRAALALLGLLCLIGPLTALSATPAHATDNGSWSVAPTPPKQSSPTARDYFILEGDPGTRIKDKVRIQNWTKKPITFKLYGADGYNTSKDGFFALKTRDVRMVGLGTWIKPLTSQVTVYGRTQVDVPITIKIPKNATPGDHVGGVVAMNVAVESTGAGIDVGVQRAVGARVYVRVSGPTTPALEVSDVQLEHDRGFLPWSGSGHGTVTYTVENTGNVRLSPDTVIRLTGVGGEITKVDGPPVELLPGQVAELREEVTGVPAFGRVTTTVTLSTSEGAGDRAEATTWLTSWPGLLGFLALLALLGGFAVRRRGLARRRLRAAEEAPLLTVSADR